jgi:hypothetical protein
MYSSRKLIQFNIIQVETIQPTYVEILALIFIHTALVYSIHFDFADILLQTCSSNHYTLPQTVHVCT